MRFYDRFLKGVKPTVQRPAGRGPDQRRQVARRGQLAPRRRDGLHQPAAAGHLHRRRPGRRHQPRLRRRLDDLPAAAPRRAPGRLRQGRSSTSPPPCRGANLVVDVYDLDQSGTGPLITRQGYLVRQRRQGHARPLVGRLEGRAGPPDRRPRDRRQRRLVDPRSRPLGDGHGRRRHGDAAVPAPSERTRTIQGDPGTQLAGLPVARRSPFRRRRSRARSRPPSRCLRR